MFEVYDNLTALLLMGGILIIGCVVFSKVSSRFSMPGLLMFLLIGMGLHVICELYQGTVGVTNHLPWRHANVIGTVALTFILFSGGFDSSLDDIKKVFRTGTLLSTLGVLLTTLFLGDIAYILAFLCGHPMPLSLCLLFGAIISSTDASAVFSILRSKRVSLQGNLKPLLEYESGSNDPMATFLTLFFLELCKPQHGGDVLIGGIWKYLMILPEFVYKMGVGIAVGVAVAALAVWLFNHLNLDYDGLYYVLGLAVAILTYSLADVCHANGFMAAYAGGVYMGSKRFVFRNSISRFMDAIGWLMQVVLFTLLGFMANPRVIAHYWWFGILLGFILMFIARPLATFACMVKSGYSQNAKILVSWVGLRGGAPIMLATFPMLIAATDYQAVEVASIGSTNVYEIIFNLIFCMVLISVVVQSFTIMPLARALKLDSPLKMAPTAPISFDQVAFHQTPPKGAKSDANADDLSYNEPATYQIPEKSDLHEKLIRELDLPKGVFIVMISRDARWIVPRGDTRLAVGDSLTVLATPENQVRAEEFFHKTYHAPVDHA